MLGTHVFSIMVLTVRTCVTVSWTFTGGDALLTRKYLRYNSCTQLVPFRPDRNLLKIFKVNNLTGNSQIFAALLQCDYSDRATWKKIDNYSLN